MKDEYLGVKLFKARKLIDKFSSQLMLFVDACALCEDMGQRVSSLGPCRASLIRQGFDLFDGLWGS